MTSVDTNRRRLLSIADKVANPAKLSDRFSDHPLQTQHGLDYNFYTDLVKERITIVNFFYTACNGICLSTTANLLQVHSTFHQRFEQYPW